jgi:hypothetical protein
MDTLRIDIAYSALAPELVLVAAALVLLLVAITRGRPQLVMLPVGLGAIALGAWLAAAGVLVPGVIDSCSNYVEHPELVAERIVRIARLVGRENVIASTDCGFAQGPFYRRVHPSIMWAKFEAMAEGARIASRELWS